MMETACIGILLIRHGETENAPEYYNPGKNRPDPPLTAIGERQAELLGRRLAGSGIQMICASDLRRAEQTARIANRHIGAQIVIREELREIDMGRLHHCSWEDIQREDPAFHSLWHRHEADLPYPGGECGSEAATRAMKVINEIIDGDLEKVAVVCHGGIVRILLCEALGIGQEKRFLFGPPENTSISTIRYDRRKAVFSVASVNDAGHLS